MEFITILFKSKTVSIADFSILFLLLCGENIQNSPSYIATLAIELNKIRKLWSKITNLKTVIEFAKIKINII